MLKRKLAALVVLPVTLCLSTPVLAEDESSILEEMLEDLEDENSDAEQQDVPSDEASSSDSASDESSSETSADDGVLTEDSVMGTESNDGNVLTEDDSEPDNSNAVNPLGAEQADAAEGGNDNVLMEDGGESGNSDAINPLGAEQANSAEDAEQGATGDDVLTEDDVNADEQSNDSEVASESDNNQDNESQAAADSAGTGVDFLEGVTCGAEGPCVIEATGLPMRALPRSFTPLFDAPGEDGRMISNAVSGFKPVYVFGVQGIDDSEVTDVQGWYQVGFTSRRAMGWMQAKDVIEWRQALLLEYLHPGVGEAKRSPVLMFESEQALSDVVMSPTRKKDAASLLAAVNNGEVPEGVIGKEPAQFLNIDDTFYLLPVVDWRRTALDEPSYDLEVFAAVPGQRADEAGDSTLEDENYLAEDAFVDIKDSLVDIVFVMDMTGSMQRYINAVKDSMVEMLELINESDVAADRIRFGLVGYRDSIEATPELEWDVKNFTPELQDADAFVQTISSAEAATVSSDEWAEDVHGGYQAGYESAWRSSPKADSATGEARKSVRFMILIGDASGHDMNDDIRGYKNSAEMNESDLLEKAKAKGIYPYTLYLQDERAEPDWAAAQSQFAALATDTSGSGRSTYSASTANAGTNIKDTVRYIGEQVVCRIVSETEDACTGVVVADNEASAPAEDDDGVGMIEVADGVMRAAFADYYGDSAQPAKDFLSWVHDYDLADPNREALGVRVLITRQQFDNIVRQTEVLADTMEGVATGNMDFYVALQAASAKTSLGLDVTEDQSLEEQEFLPKWVASLPYKSAVLAITPGEFANMNESERKQFRAQLDSKRNAYLEIAGDTGRWFKLDENDDKLQEVVALPLTSLP